MRVMANKLETIRKAEERAGARGDLGKFLNDPENVGYNSAALEFVIEGVLLDSLSGRLDCETRRDSEACAFAILVDMHDGRLRKMTRKPGMAVSQAGELFKAYGRSQPRKGGTLGEFMIEVAGELRSDASAILAKYSPSSTRTR